MSLVKRHPIITFFVLTYVLAWAPLPFGTFGGFALLVAALIVIPISQGVAGREHPHPCRKLGRHVHHTLTGRCQPPCQMPTEAAGGLHRPTTLGEPLRPAFEGPQAGAVVQEASTLEGSSPKASSTIAKATEPLWGSTPIKTFMSARTSVSVGPLPSARAKDIPPTTSCRAHTSFESLRTPRSPVGRKPRTIQPILWATGSSRAILVSGALEA